MKNVKQYLYDVPVIEVEAFPALPEVGKKKKRFTQAPEALNLPTSIEPSLEQSQGIAGEHTDIYTRQGKNDLNISTRQKIKTRGIPNKKKTRKFDENHAAPTQKSNISPIDPTVDAKKESLKRIIELRKRRTVKENKISSELTEVRKFLKGQIENIDGSEHRLVWRQGIKQYGLKYETPHKTDAGVYKGNKLRRVLNVMEIAYRIGLDSNIDAFIEANKHASIRNFTRFLRFALTNS